MIFKDLQIGQKFRTANPGIGGRTVITKIKKVIEVKPNGCWERNTFWLSDDTKRVFFWSAEDTLEVLLTKENEYL